MSLSAAEFAVNFVKDQQKVQKGGIYNPFCGKGTVLALSDKVKLSSVSIDNDKARCAEARSLSF